MTSTIVTTGLRLPGTRINPITSGSFLPLVFVLLWAPPRGLPPLISELPPLPADSGPDDFGDGRTREGNAPVGDDGQDERGDARNHEVPAPPYGACAVRG